MLSLAASEPRNAILFSGHVEIWLRILSYRDDVAAKARELRETAFDAALSEGETGVSAKLLELLDGDRHREAALLAAQGNHDEAAAIYEELDLPQRALECWRKAGRWHKALALAGDGRERELLAWLCKIDDLCGSAPDELSGGLFDAERDRLVAVLAGVISKSGPTDR